MEDYVETAARLVHILGSAGARDLLKLLDQPDDVRADAFRQLHERGEHDALLDTLTELEADPVMRGWLAENLRLVLDQAT